MVSTIREVDDAAESALAQTYCCTAAPRPGLGPNQKIHDAEASSTAHQSLRRLFRLFTRADAQW